MSNYIQSTNFATKDALSSGDPLKIVKGTEINTEFNNIAVAVATKADLVSPTFTGTVTAPVVVGNVTGNATTATSTPKLLSTNFTIEESGGKLIFKHGVTTIASLSSTGEFTSLSTVTGGGTP